MTRFIINITLHSAGETDYKRLRQEMEKESFTAAKKYPGKDDKGYLLRIAEFSREGTFALKDITDAAFKAAQKTGKEFSFTVIKDKSPAHYLPVSKNSAAHKMLK